MANLFKAVDADGAGTVSAAELHAFVRELSDACQADVEVAACEAFNKFATDALDWGECTLAKWEELCSGSDPNNDLIAGDQMLARACTCPARH